MSTIIAKFFNDKLELNIETVHDMNFSTKISILPFNWETICYYNNLCNNNSTIKIYSFLSKRKFSVYTIHNEFEYNNIYGDIFYADCIIEFIRNVLYIWKQYENKFYVVFGKKDIIKKIDNYMINENDFLEVINDDFYLSDKGKQYLMNALEIYG